MNRKTHSGSSANGGAESALPPCIAVITLKTNHTTSTQQQPQCNVRIFVGIVVVAAAQHHHQHHHHRQRQTHTCTNANQYPNQHIAIVLAAVQTLWRLNNGWNKVRVELGQLCLLHTECTAFVRCNLKVGVAAAGQRC